MERGSHTTNAVCHVVSHLVARGELERLYNAIQSRTWGLAGLAADDTQNKSALLFLM